MASSRLDSSNWKHGEVNLFSALGFKQPFTYPKLTAVLPGDVAAAQQQQTNKSPGTSGGVPSLPKSGKYSLSQLEQIWVAAGGKPAYKLVAACIAMAESGGDPNATDKDSNGTTDKGLWQINTSHGSQSTYNVLANARAAVSISSNGSNWTPWTTYTSGAWMKYLPNSIPQGQSLPSTMSTPSSRLIS